MPSAPWRYFEKPLLIEGKIESGALGISRLRQVLLGTAVGSVVILSLRSALGAFTLWGANVVVASPFSVESVFWFSVLGLMLLGRQPGVFAESRHKPTGMFPRIYLVAVLCLIALAFLPDVRDPFLSDDYILLNLGHFNWKLFATYFHTAGGDGSWRSLGYAYFEIVRALAGTNPLKWHLFSLAIHIANSALIFRIAWKLWYHPAAAAVASLIFGLNGTRPEVAVWTAGSFDLFATLCVLGAVDIALSERGRAKALSVVLCPLLTMAGIMFKESAYVAPLLLIAILLCRGSLCKSRVLTAGCSAVCAALFIWRWHVFGGIGGYVDPRTGRSLVESLHALTASKALAVRIWTILLVPVNWDAPASWWEPLSVMAGMLGLVALLTLRAPAPQSRRTRLALIAATCVTTLPAIHLALIGESGLGSRVLYLPCAPFALLVGSLMVRSGRRGAISAAILLLAARGRSRETPNSQAKPPAPQ